MNKFLITIALVCVSISARASVSSVIGNFTDRSDGSYTISTGIDSVNPVYDTSVETFPGLSVGVVDKRDYFNDSRLGVKAINAERTKPILVDRKLASKKVSDDARSVSEATAIMFLVLGLLGLRFISKKKYF